MPLCGTKKSKKQKRDPSPPFEQANEFAKEKEELERQYRDAKGQCDDLHEELNDVKRSRQRFQDEVDTLKKDLEEQKTKVVTGAVSVSDEADNKVLNDAKLEEIQLEIVEEKKQRQEVTDQKKKLEDDLKQANKILATERDSKLKIEEEKNRLKKMKENLEAEFHLAKQQLENVNEERAQRSPTREPTAEWKAKIQTSDLELQKEREQRMQKEREISRVASEKVQMLKEAEDLMKEVDQLKSVKDKQDGIILELQNNSENKGADLRLELDRMKERLGQEAEEKSELLSRLSNVMANQVLDGNPNITDLSDPNRPMKLGEWMSQLYDDEWTNASEEMTKLDKTDDEIPKILLDLLIATYTHCQEAAENQLARIEENIFLPPMESDTPTTPQSPPATNGQEAKSPTSAKSLSASRIPRYSSKSSRPAIGSLALDKKEAEGNEKAKEAKQPKHTLAFPRHPKGDKSIEIPVELKKGVKDFRKTVSKQVIPVIEKEILNKLRGKPEFGDAVVKACKPYIKKAVELCWLMRIQDPPVHLSWDVPNDETLDTDLYRHYTKSGSHVDYVVWPVAYLHEGGPVLLKGVAQGKA